MIAHVRRRLRGYHGELRDAVRAAGPFRRGQMLARSHGTKSFIAAVLASIALLLLGGIALAYVHEASHVSATGGAGTVTPAGGPSGSVTVAGATASGAAIYPGGPAGDLTFTVTNPNSRTVTITALSLSAATCALTLTLPANTLPIGITAVSGASQVVDLPGVLTMGTTAAATCQNAAALSVPLTATVHM